MNWLRTILWVSVVVATTVGVFAQWKGASVSKMLGDELLSKITAPTLADIEKARAAEPGESVRVGVSKLRPSRHSVGKVDGEYYTFDALTGEKLPHSPTDEDIRLLDLGEEMLFWDEMKRYAAIAAAVLLLGALGLQFGFRDGI